EITWDNRPLNTGERILILLRKINSKRRDQRRDEHVTALLRHRSARQPQRPSRPKGAIPYHFRESPQSSRFSWRGEERTLLTPERNPTKNTPFGLLAG